jgi:hypothetical protein
MGRSRRARLLHLGVPCLFALTALLAATPAPAADLKVREVYPGSAAHPASEYVELQMTANGQGSVSGRELVLYDGSGTATATYTLSGNVANGDSQRTILLGTPQVIEDFEVPALDFELPEDDALSGAAGAACFVGGAPSDCATWGPFPLFGPQGSFPNWQTTNGPAIPDGMALGRSISAGCPIMLDDPDDTNSGSADFSTVTPSPRTNDGFPSEFPCPPDTTVTAFPANPSNLAAATFSYGALPSGEAGVTFKCSLDDANVANFTDCTPGATKVYPGPLADGQHVFRVFATGPGGADPSPASYTWTVDTVAPETTIDSGPASPSGGFSATFAFRSSEPSSSFRCQLDDGITQFCSGSKTYINLASGSHRFRVWAVDNAGNQDQTPALYDFVVDTALEDVTAPDTAIVTAPPGRNASDAAAFTYRASEAAAGFECSLDGAPFAACSAAGVAYSGLPNGPHSFSVLAIDLAGNRDPAPATYTWTVAAPLPVVRILAAPGGQTTLKGAGVKRIEVTFKLAASKPGSSFRCRLDRQPFRTCRSVTRFKVGVGRHRFEAYAVDALGNVGTATTRRIFRVQRPRAGGLF